MSFHYGTISKILHQQIEYGFRVVCMTAEKMIDVICRFK